MKNITWSLPVIILRNVVIMPGAASHLDVINKESCEAVKQAMKADSKVFMLAAKGTVGDKNNVETFKMGVVATIKQFVKMPDKTLRILVDVEKRAEMIDYENENGFITAQVEMIEKTKKTTEDPEEITICRMLAEKLKMAFSNGLGSNKILFKQVMSIKGLDDFSDGVAEFIPIPFEKKQEILEMTDVRERAMYLLKTIDSEMEILKIKAEISEKLKDCVSKHQKEYVLREQLKVIKQELGEDENDNLAEDFEARLKKLNAPEETYEKLKKEISRYKSIPSASAESGVMSNYIDTLLDYPWSVSAKENKNLKKAISVLEKDHYGLEEVKERIIDYLAVKILNNKGNMPIICLVGPPGTGKTSIAKSIAKATGRKYVRMSLGGVRDEAEIRGHRKTYIGSMPGRVVTSISKTGTNNPLVLLDEIDKVSSDYKGDVASALLEVLDSEQNNKFSDHYFEVPVDLSNVLFVATANDLSNIPGPLLDRMEIINISGYTETEKFHIAKLYLVNKARLNNGLTKTNFKINDEAIKYIIRCYTREAGVRELERNLDKLCRKACRQLLTQEDQIIKVTKTKVSDMLGTEKYSQEKTVLDNKIGVVRGLAWTAVGGVTLDIEVNILPGAGKLQLTGKLGDVMKESAIAALSYIRSLPEAENLGEDFFEKHEIHIHIPEGAVPKDGPSAGITMATAIYSALFNSYVKGDVAMTGEITLRGTVLPIGGLKEKLLAAKNVGVKLVVVPKDNEKDLRNIPEEITEGMKLVFVQNMTEVLKNVLA